MDTREIIVSDIPKIIDYFLLADHKFLKGMGADKDKLPDRQGWTQKLLSEMDKVYAEKDFFYVIWLLDDQPVGHSNINNIIFKKTATMHLHLWQKTIRKSGLGVQFVKKSIPYYFKHFELEKIICEPYEKNMAPQKTLKKAGFKFIRSYETTPGWINFHQTVCRYELTRADFEAM